MKILHTVQFYDPSTGGMQEVVKQISEHLVKRGHQVTVATSRDPARKSCSINGVAIREFTISGNFITGLQGETHAYQNFLLHSDFDIITNFAAQQWATDLMLPLLPEITAKKVFVPTGFSALHDPAFAIYFEKMEDWMKEYDMNVFLSESYQDCEFARRAGIKNFMIIPNGASAEEFLSPDETDIRKELKIPEDQFIILHVGSHTGLKGHAEAIRIFNRAKLNHVTFVLVGNIYSRRCYWSCKLRELLSRHNPWNRIRGRQLLVCSLSRKQTIALYNTADLFLFPSNIECSPIVLFECMASKTPFLTTDVGNAREIIEWSHAGELLPTRKDSRGYSHVDVAGSVGVLEAICNNKEQRTRMGEAGNHAWLQKFSWEQIAQSYEAVYSNLLESGAP
jgi:glycosyltransferase involved in cell wall biosynthesis